MNITLQGVPQALRALSGFAHGVQTRGTRVALNAALGVVKNQVVSNLRRHSKTGLLAKSQRVKVRVPQASRNPAHHDKPAWGLVGAGKGLTGVRTKRGAKVLSAKAKATAKAAGTKTMRPSRYSHFPEEKHGDLAAAARTAGPAAQAKFASKISQFANAEAARLASKP